MTESGGGVLTRRFAETFYVNGDPGKPYTIRLPDRYKTDVRLNGEMKTPLLILPFEIAWEMEHQAGEAGAIPAGSERRELVVYNEADFYALLDKAMRSDGRLDILPSLAERTEINADGVLTVDRYRPEIEPDTDLVRSVLSLEKTDDPASHDNLGSAMGEVSSILRENRIPFDGKISDSPEMPYLIVRGGRFSIRISHAFDWDKYMNDWKSSRGRSKPAPALSASK